MKIILHVGSLKTGSTYLQSMIWANRQAFAAAGILIPHTGVQSQHHYDVARAAGFGFAEQSLGHQQAEAILAALSNEIATSNCSAALLSSEHFDLSVSTSAISRLKHCLAGHELRVVIFLRNQVELAQSLYFEHVKWGAVQPFGQFVAHELRHGTFAYDERITKWIRAGVEVCVIDYSQARNDLGPYLLQQIPGAPSVADLVMPVGAVNESLAPEAMEHLRQANLSIPDMQTRRAGYVELFNRLNGHDSYWRKSRACQIPAEMLEALPALTRRNRRLATMTGQGADFLQGDLLAYAAQRSGAAELDMEAFYNDLELRGL